MKLYRYVMTYDTGLAPNPYHGYCTLALCKPQIRRTAQVGDWIMGLGSVGAGLGRQLIYAMQISETLSFEEYWDDPRFECKKPRVSSDMRLECGDNVYRRGDGTDAWIQLPCHHCDEDMHRDLKVNRVLIGTRFVYFGSSACDLPAECMNWDDKYFVGIRGHRVADLAAWQVDELVDWLESLCQGSPLRGVPAETRELTGGVSARATDWRPVS